MDDENEVEINALVLGQVEGKLFEHIADAEIPEGSITRLYRGRWVHLILRDEDGKLSLPEIKPEMTGVPSPNDAYCALRCPEAPKLFCEAENPWVPVATKGFGAVIAGLLIILFFIWAASLS